MNRMNDARLENELSNGEVERYESITSKERTQLVYRNLSENEIEGIERKKRYYSITSNDRVQLEYHKL